MSRQNFALQNNDPTYAEAMGRAGRAYYEAHYAWDVVMATYERLLARVART